MVSRSLIVRKRIIERIPSTLSSVLRSRDLNDYTTDTRAGDRGSGLYRISAVQTAS
ncbi:hypothetical protein NITLEN_30081 [Nitrospira lenta]|uniref:Uncharacterized protein n=1 Tax=Nitrospira lenta TaxID=1436998 RepID=A0A330L748_9BACT|nr:hypothetical protein NITLEN_30081 [Nitrospira lenta]